MKKISLYVLILCFSLISLPIDAQVRVRFNVNFGQQPVWGPSGYDHVAYYYLPDIDAYYNVSRQQYIYMEGGRWVFVNNLPERFHYNIYNGYKVVVNESSPYRHADVYRKKYGSFKGRTGQAVIRDSHDPRYFENKDHPEHNKWNGNNWNHGKHGDNGNKGDNGHREGKDNKGHK